MQLELEVTSDWIKFDGRKFEKVADGSASPSMSTPSNRKKLEAIGSAKYVVTTDTEHSDVEYTEEEVELNLSDETDDDDSGFNSRFAKANNPFDQPAPPPSPAPLGMGALLASLAGGGSPGLPARTVKDSHETEPGAAVDAKPQALSESAGVKPSKPTADSHPFGGGARVESASAPASRPATAASSPAVSAVDTNPFGMAEATKPAAPVATSANASRSIGAQVIPTASSNPLSTKANAVDLAQASVVGAVAAESGSNRLGHKAVVAIVEPSSPSPAVDASAARVVALTSAPVAKPLVPADSARPAAVTAATVSAAVSPKPAANISPSGTTAALLAASQRPATAAAGGSLQRAAAATEPATSLRPAAGPAPLVAAAEGVPSASPTKSLQGDGMSSLLEELRGTIARQRKELDHSRETERRFQNSLTLAERKATAAEAQLLVKERELARLQLQLGREERGGPVGDQGRQSLLEQECNVLHEQLLQLEEELQLERRQREMCAVIEKNVFLAHITFNREAESVSALRIFDDFVRMRLFDATAENGLLLDRLLHSISMLCQLPNASPDVISYWVVSGWQLLKLLRAARRRASAPVDDGHALNAFDRNLVKLVLTLYTRLFTCTLRRIEQLLIESLGAPYERDNYFNPSKLAMGRLIEELAALWKGLCANQWPAEVVRLFFGLCIDLVNRFLLNRVLLSSEYCTFNNGVRIKMEMAFLAQWLGDEPHGGVIGLLAERLEPIVEAAQLLTMSKTKSNLAALSQFRALNGRQMHQVLQQYRGSQDASDVVDAALLRYLEEWVPRLHAQELPVSDTLPTNLGQLEALLNEET